MNESFWVIENKKVNLYLGNKCGKAHWCVGIDDALKFEDKESALVVLELVEMLGKDYKITEHLYLE